jgi:hypothetical protein
VTLMTTASLPVQLDGEPWRQKPCNMEISLGERLVNVHNHYSYLFIVIMMIIFVLIVQQ